MALFEQLYNNVMRTEGGYNPNDQGYPAYRGINRGFHPGWNGWGDLDRLKPKTGSIFAELEPKVQAFYKSFWAPVKWDKVKEVKVAQLLVDMKTQHGRWAAVVNAGLYGNDPFKAPLVYGDKEVELINSDPGRAYKGIAAARLDYCRRLKLANEKDRKGIIARAQAFVNDALTWIKENPGKAAAGGGGLLLATALGIFLLSKLKRNA